MYKFLSYFVQMHKTNKQMDVDRGTDSSYLGME